MSFAFYIAAAIAVLAALLAVTRIHPIHSLLYFVLMLLAVAVVFLTLGAPFAAALEVIINAGAIMVMFIFVVILINPGPRAIRKERRWTTLGVWILPALISAVLLAELVYLIGNGLPGAPSEAGPKAVALALLGPYAAAVELASLLLLAGLVGAYHLARTDSPKREN